MLFRSPPETKILIGEVESVDISEEFAHEKLSPVLAMYKAKTFDEAIAKAEQLVADGGYGHTSALYIDTREKEKMEMARKKRDPKKVALAQAILEAYQPQTAQEMNNALKDLFGPLMESMLQGELNHHLGYESHDKGPKKDANRRNGYGKKILKTTQGEVEIEVPRDRNGSFEPQLVQKR